MPAWLSHVATNSLFIALFSAGVLYISYKLYGTFLAGRVFGFDDRHKVPSEELRDGIDFVPTHPAVLFGHHFASIAGLGPILGPAIAVYWGWVPAIAWVLVGCVLIGGVHDVAAILISIRHKARSIGDVTNEIIGPRARLLFLIIIFFLLALAMGVFAITMANLFNDLSPQAVVPTFALIGIAMVIGTLVYRFRVRLLPVTIIGVVLMFVTTYAGLELPVPLYRMYTGGEVEKIIAVTDDPDLPSVHGIRATRAAAAAHYFEQRAQSDPALKPLHDNVVAAGNQARSTWVYILLAYAFFASVLPVWFLLQPRDYINSFQLYIGLGLLVIGLVIWHPPIRAHAFTVLDSAADDNAPGVLPFIFIIIACGAVSGFHNLVSSGTTARQLRRESDARIIGYGAMLTEGLLAVLVILACVAGLSATEYQAQYGGWTGLDKRALGAFLTGAGNVIARPFMLLTPETSHAPITLFCRNFIAVVVVSFAMTTLDSATRLLRYNVEEIGRLARFKPASNRYVASIVAVAAIGWFALLKIDGKPAGLTLWQLFGTTNQLLAALGLLVASLYLYQLRRPVVYTLVPMLVMVVSVTWAMSIKLTEFYRGWRAGGDVTNLSLLIVGGALAAMAAWMVVEGGFAFRRTRRRHQIEEVSNADGAPAAASTR